MGGFVERFRRPKPPVVLGSPREGEVVPPQSPVTPRNPRSPVLRNFSYPISVTNNHQSPLSPSNSRAGQTAWDQLGEICNFSPDSASRAGRGKKLALEDPFFYSNDQPSYYQLADDDQELGVGWETSSPLSFNAPSQDPANEKSDKQESHTEQSENNTTKLASASIVTAKFKRNSLGHYRHKTATSLDAGQIITLPRTSLERPVSSSGIETRFKAFNSNPISSSTASADIQSSGLDLSVDTDNEYSTSQAAEPSIDIEIDLSRCKMSSHDHRNPDEDGQRRGGSRGRTSSTTESVKGKGKEGKGRWLAQLKDWVSAAEPSSQALKHYKKDMYKRNGIALDDPRANAKLHLPVGTLPPEAIKPSGPGLEPEEIMLKKTEQPRKLRQSYSGTPGTPQGSRSSHYSSSSSVAHGGMRDDFSR
ncbi:hypothetical protein F4778DRAFT_791192 [Xylariomycetidae sp. FL2044]|nr:hypothetical protein F4778DRAFT_791192 [Xylariomycetidae sp. FL2044]